MTFAEGVKLGPYEIVSAIGAGGQGEVYKARDTRLNHTVEFGNVITRRNASVRAVERWVND